MPNLESGSESKVERNIERIEQELRASIKRLEEMKAVPDTEYKKPSNEDKQEALDLIHSLENEKREFIEKKRQEIKSEIEKREKSIEDLGDASEYTEYVEPEAVVIQEEIDRLKKELKKYPAPRKVKKKIEVAETAGVAKQEVGNVKVKVQESEYKYEFDTEYKQMLEDACLEWHKNDPGSIDYFNRSNLTFERSANGYLLDSDGKETHVLPSQIDPAEFNVKNKVEEAFLARHPEFVKGTEAKSQVKSENAPVEESEVSAESKPETPEVKSGGAEKENIEPSKTPEANKVSSESKDEENEKKIRGCQNFEELSGVLKEIGNIKGSEVDFSAEELEAIITLVKGNKLSINWVTRSLGLRETVIRLLEEGGVKDKTEAVPPPLPQEGKKSEKDVNTPENMEDAFTNLDAMRMRYMVENKKYMEGRKTKSLIGGLWQKLRGIKPEAENELPQELVEAKENFDKAKVLVGKQMMKDEKERLSGLNLKPEEIAAQLEAYKGREVFEKVILDEHDLLEKFRQEAWPPKEKGVFFKALAWYGKQSRPTKLAIGTLIAVGGAAAGGMSAPAVALFAGSYLARGALAAGAGLLAGKGFEKLVKDKSGMHFSDAVEDMRKQFGKEQIDYKTVEDYFRSASETKQKEHNKYNLAKNLVIGATAAWANVGMTLIESHLAGIKINFSNSGLHRAESTPTSANVGEVAPTHIDTMEIPPAPIETGYSHVVGSHDNMWTILRSDLSKSVPDFNHLSRAAQHNAIDTLWQKFVHASPSELKSIGIASGNPHILANGATIKVSEMIDQDMMTKAVSQATKLTASQLASLNHDTTVLNSALKGYKGPIREALVNKILAVKR